MVEKITRLKVKEQQNDSKYENRIWEETDIIKITVRIREFNTGIKDTWNGQILQWDITKYEIR